MDAGPCSVGSYMRQGHSTPFFFENFGTSEGENITKLCDELWNKLEAKGETGEVNSFTTETRPLIFPRATDEEICFSLPGEGDLLCFPGKRDLSVS